jgi:hypothetical protein
MLPNLILYGAGGLGLWAFLRGNHSKPDFSSTAAKTNVVVGNYTINSKLPATTSTTSTAKPNTWQKKWDGPDPDLPRVFAHLKQTLNLKTLPDSKNKVLKDDYHYNFNNARAKGYIFPDWNGWTKKAWTLWDNTPRNTGIVGALDDVGQFFKDNGEAIGYGLAVVGSGVATVLTLGAAAPALVAAVGGATSAIAGTTALASSVKNKDAKGTVDATRKLAESSGI